MIFFSLDYYSPLLPLLQEIWKEEEKVMDYGQVPAREERELSESLPLLAGGMGGERKRGLRNKKKERQ